MRAIITVRYVQQQPCNTATTAVPGNYNYGTSTAAVSRVQLRHLSTYSKTEKS